MPTEKDNEDDPHDSADFPPQRRIDQYRARDALRSRSSFRCLTRYACNGGSDDQSDQQEGPSIKIASFYSQSCTPQRLKLEGNGRVDNMLKMSAWGVFRTSSAWDLNVRIVRTAVVPTPGFAERRTNGRFPRCTAKGVVWCDQ